MIPKKYPVIIKFDTKHHTFHKIVLNREKFIDVCYEFVEYEINNALSVWNKSENGTVENFVKFYYNIDFKTYEMILTNPNQILVSSMDDVKKIVLQNVEYNKCIEDAQLVVGGTLPKERAVQIMSFMFRDKFQVIDPD